MPLRINTNLAGQNAHRILRNTGKDLTKRVERLSSGLKVNRAADDAAGLSVSEGLRGENSGFTQGIRNSEQAINLVQTAEGALSEINSILLRMRELSVQSASSTVNDDNRASLNAEFNQLVSEIDRVATVTSYNNSTLLSGFGNVVSQNTGVSTALDLPFTGVVNVQTSGAEAGTYSFIDTAGDGEITATNGIVSQTLNVRSALDVDTIGSVVATGSSVIANFDRLGIQLTLNGQRAATIGHPATDGYRNSDLDGRALVIESGTGGTFQVGPDDGFNHRIEANISDMRASGAKLNLSGMSLSTLSSSMSAISPIDLAINQVTRARVDLGATQNRLSYNIRANGVMLENDKASDAIIRDADLAFEVSAFSKAQILNQAGLSMFAQANISAAQVLSLL